jgi:hypothetical protein
VGLGIDQHARIEQAMRIQGRIGSPEGSGKQWWARRMKLVTAMIIAVPLDS